MFMYVPILRAPLLFFCTLVRLSDAVSASECQTSLALALASRLLLI